MKFAAQNECPKFVNGFCEELSQQFKEPHRVGKLFCLTMCRQNPDMERDPFFRCACQVHYVGRIGPFTDRVFQSYRQPLDIHIPPVTDQIISDLSSLRAPGYLGFVLTGSIFLKLGKPKDVDIILWFDSVRQIEQKELRALPKTIAGIKTDFFFGIGANRESIYACMDPVRKVLVVSPLLELNIRTIEPGISIQPASLMIDRIIRTIR